MENEGSLKIRRVRILVTGAALFGVLSSLLPGGPANLNLAHAAADRLVIKPEADTFVNAGEPKKAQGSNTVLRAGLDPKRIALIRFPLGGVSGTIESASLRLTSRQAVPQGGTVVAMNSTAWSESVTWATRPNFSGQTVGTFGQVSTGPERMSVSPGLLGGSKLSLAIKVGRSGGPRWASRESSAPPQLVLNVAPQEVDGLSVVTDPQIGSSDPTWFGSNHRAAVTDEDRMLVVHGKHLTGVQLAWRDPGGEWQNATTGRASNGLLWANGGTGDWTASIAVGVDSQGVEHAWVVWGGWSGTGDRAIAITRLNKIDSDNGPQIGPVVPIAPSGEDDMGSKVDLALEPKPSGGFRGVVSWQRQTESTSEISGGKWELVTKWFTDLDSDSPTFHDEKVLLTSSGSGGYSRVVTLAPGPFGVHAVVRSNEGRIALHSHNAGDPLSTWAQTAGDTVIAAGTHPSAVTLDSGDVVAVVTSSSSNHTVSVVTWDAQGSGFSALTTQGNHPSAATNGTDVWIVMATPVDDPIQETSGSIFSQQLDTSSAQLGPRVEEISAEQCDPLGIPVGCEWPNAVRRVDGRLRFIVEGPQFDDNQSSVLAYQRTL